jgi:hypothetical protein
MAECRKSEARMGRRHGKSAVWLSPYEARGADRRPRVRAAGSGKVSCGYRNGDLLGPFLLSL